jgi:hypothetical protein
LLTLTPDEPTAVHIPAARVSKLKTFKLREF